MSIEIIFGITLGTNSRVHRTSQNVNGIFPNELSFLRYLCLVSAISLQLSTLKIRNLYLPEGSK